MAVEASSLDLWPAFSVAEKDDLLVRPGADERKDLLDLGFRQCGGDVHQRTTPNK